MMIREAKLCDIPALISIASTLVGDAMGVVPDTDKIKSMLVASISAKKHKVLVSLDADGNVKGGMLTVSDGFDFASKQYAQIVCLFSQVPGHGKQMLDMTMEWVQGRRAIQMVCYSSPMQSAVDGLLLKNNFKATGSMIAWRRYGTIQ